MNIEIRRAVESDLQSLTDIYNHYVVETPITFDLEPKTLEQRAEWLSQYHTNGPCQLFVATDNGAVVGYAGSGQFREKKAYETSVETTVYLSPDTQKLGIGTLLYRALFAAIEPADVHRAYAGITLPNAASVALHEKFNFVSLGRYQEVGRKFGQYWDVEWFEKSLD